MNCPICNKQLDASGLVYCAHAFINGNVYYWDNPIETLIIFNDSKLKIANLIFLDQERIEKLFLLA